MKILKMTMELGDNDLYTTKIIAENAKRTFTCVMKVSRELFLDGIFGETLSGVLMGQHNHLIALDGVKPGIMDVANNLGLLKKSLTRKTSGKSGNMGKK